MCFCDDREALGGTEKRPGYRPLARLRDPSTERLLGGGSLGRTVSKGATRP
jgi:hypothetical protein